MRRDRSVDLAKGSDRDLTPSFQFFQEGPLAGDGNSRGRIVEEKDPFLHPFIPFPGLDSQGALANGRQRKLAQEGSR